MKKLIFALIFTASPVVKAQYSLQEETVYKSKSQDVIWGFDFLNPTTAIITEREGKMFVLDLNRKGAFEVSGVPKVWAKGQGGLLDVRKSPTEADTIYFTFVTPEGDGGTTALAKAQIKDRKLQNLQVLFKAKASTDEKIHFGSRIEFDNKGHVYVTVGDRNTRPEVQDLKFHTGKLIRLTLQGAAPNDNPFRQNKDALPEIYALGLRSPQGLAIHPETGDLWEAEMGPRGGDEINLVKKGANYGWPDVTYGREYWGPSIGEGTTKPGVEEPVVYWTPSISPSAITFYTGSLFPAWKNNMFIATLSGQHLRRLVIDKGRVVQQEELFKAKKERFRSVRTGPEGALYYSTDSGLLVKVTPKAP